MSRPDGRVRTRLRLQHARHGWRWVEASVVNRLDDPAVEGLVCTFRDVTDQHDQSTELRRLRARTARRSPVSARPTGQGLVPRHRVPRAPHAAHVGPGIQRILEDSGTEFDDEALRTVIDRISANARTMEDMIEQLLDYSRLQAGRVQVDCAAGPDRGGGDDRTTSPTTCVHHEVVVEVGEHRSWPTGRASITSSGTCSRTRPATRASGPASRSDAPNGRRRGAASTSPITASVSLPTTRRRSSRASSRRLPASTARRGTGVGLNIARRYAQLQAGHLTLESTLGEGSTFTFDLPAAE